MKFIASLVIFIVGIIQIIFPEESYFFGRRWMYKNEPELSELQKILIRSITSVILIIIAAWLIII